MQSGARQLKQLACALALLLWAPVLAAQELREVSNVIWSLRPDWFGGFSGAEVAHAGAEMTLITDRGRLLQVRLIRRDGALRAIQLLSEQALRAPDQTELEDETADAEGLAVVAGQAFVSFEKTHRVMRLDLKTGLTAALGDDARFSDFSRNSGLEALALHPDGTLYALPERSGKKDRPFPLLALRAGHWEVAGQIPRRGPFLPVGADFDDQGLFYLVERAATPLGFRSRIRRFDFSAPDLGEVTLLTSGPGRYDNLEAISFWRTAQGTAMLTLISDDNFLRIQRTQIVEFAVAE